MAKDSKETKRPKRITTQDMLKQSLLSVIASDEAHIETLSPQDTPTPPNTDIIPTEETPSNRVNDKITEIPSEIPNTVDFNRANNRADDHPVTYSVNRISDQPTDSPDNRADNRITETQNNRVYNRDTEIPSNLIILPEINWKRKPADLNNHQFQMLHAVYFHRPFKVDAERNDGIGDLIIPPVSVDNVRSRIKSLIKKGYILDRFGVNCAPHKMTTCIVNTDKCLPLFGETHIKNEDQYKLKNNTVDPATFNRVTYIPNDRVFDKITETQNYRANNRDTDSPNNREKSLISSSSSIYKSTTTTRDSVTEWVKSQMQHPEIEFWAENKISDTQVLKAIESVIIEPEVLIQSMKYYAHEYSKPDAKQPDTNHWFYFLGGVKKNGMWLRPLGYESHEERAIRIKDEISRAKEEELARLRESNLRAEQLELEIEFERFFERFAANPDDPEFQSLYDATTNTFELERLKKKSRLTVKAVWSRLVGLKD